ncbi:hypothetical protein OAG85_03630 [Verrucomicrobiales bacterium]|nr:hypothetical protein [bacterium]MDB4809001.1 hypothetical protein [Verrucomicrobiales bacterium]
METLTIAHGYFDLRLFTEAWETLDALPVQVRESNEAMELRLKILAATERWEKLQWLAEGLTVSTSGWACPWFYLAMGKAKTGHVEKAKEAIEKLVDLDPDWRLRVLEDPAFESVW